MGFLARLTFPKMYPRFIFLGNFMLAQSQPKSLSNANNSQFFFLFHGLGKIMEDS